MIETFKNKDGSITTRVTTVEETTISAEEVDAVKASKEAQLKGVYTRLEEVDVKYEKLKEQEVVSLKNLVSTLEEELKAFN